MTDRSGLLTCFYILVFVLCIDYIIQTIMFCVIPDYNPFIYADPGFHVTEPTELLGTCFMLTLSWLVTAIMFQLTISLRVVFDLCSPKRAQSLKTGFYIFAAIWSSLQFIAICLIPILEYEKRAEAATYVMLVSYFIVAISYSVIIINMWMTLKEMKSFGGDFSKEKKDILS